MPEAIKYVMMRRTTDGDGPHPIHPDEVSNYLTGDWRIVEEPKVESKPVKVKTELSGKVKA